MMFSLILSLVAAQSQPRAQVARETVITVPAQSRLVCGAPRQLSTDAVQTVRYCEYQ